jgi:GTPase
LEAEKKPRLRLRNKIDLLPPAQRDALRDDSTTVHISAAKGIGLSTLLDRVDAILEEDRITRVHLRIPQKEGKVLAMLQARSRIYSRDYKDGVVDLEAEAPESVLRRLKPFLVEE